MRPMSPDEWHRLTPQQQAFYVQQQQAHHMQQMIHMQQRQMELQRKSRARTINTLVWIFVLGPLVLAVSAGLLYAIIYGMINGF